jgi:rfaE bifunctional protein kinase chain/domain
MVRLTGTISCLKSRNILVVGDLMLDTYTIGKARRISPEAPVAVIQVIKEESRPGGAGNVALNLLALGAQVTLLGRIGSDSTSLLLQEALKAEQIDTRGLFVQEGFSTPLKNRVIADNQQIVRVDYEQATPLTGTLEQQIIAALPSLMKGIEAVAISDYGKGFLSRSLLQAIIHQARQQEIPVITDPKGTDFTKYEGTTVLKPNLSEAYAAAGLLPDADLNEAAGKILQLANAKILMVTRSEAGISIFQKGKNRQDFTVRSREIKDVTGAGDTVLAMLTYAIANELTIEEAAELSNVAAGLAVERFGCARISMSELARRLLESDLTNKIFDGEHLEALLEALKGRDYLLLELSGSEGMTSSIFSTIHKLAKTGKDLVVFLRDVAPGDDFIDLLSTFNDIKFIIVQSESLANLCQKAPPAEVYAV